MELQIAQRCVERVVYAVDRHRHVHPLKRTLHSAGNQICQLHHLGGVRRLDEVFRIEISVAEMESELDILGNRAGESRKGIAQHVLHTGKWLSRWPAAVPHHHLDADVPLNCQVLVWDRLTDALHLAQHGLLVGGQDLLRMGRGQGDLKAHAVWDVASIARVEKVVVGGSSLARIAQLAKVQILWAYAVRQAEWHERDTRLIS